MFEQYSNIIQGIFRRPVYRFSFHCLYVATPQVCLQAASPQTGDRPERMQKLDLVLRSAMLEDRQLVAILRSFCELI
jgi:hypothetical protein